MVIMETKNLTKYYGKARGIIDLDLRVHEGDIFGFIGPNGAGKSTTIRTLLGLITPTSGSATIFGKDCTKDKRSILSSIGYMPSEAMFWDGMKVSEVIDLSAKLHKKDCTAESKKLCDRLQLDTKKKIEELSLGNRKKVSIVCALQHKPKLYILDEPTSGLDPLMQKEFWSLMEERYNEDATIFLSSHVLSEVQRHCKNAAIIREGKLIVSDSVTKLSQTATRRVTLHGISEMPSLEGIKDLVLQDGSVSFLYQGEMQKLISTLNSLTITDMTVLEPTLEEVFLHYYEKDGE
ncbi:ABC transporter ATP-binding protein [Tissierella sp.]|uniref:ABC transporter ATP-binding protein n=1 Tax=Tissierella sp. TaxID=41274 RepID=UPI00285E1062|nr:ABC transporter ATP-binding protein [Tissierella sp.]MDR7855753.1 ABC transporter ATP-binding protein [Tissierella sp.]